MSSRKKARLNRPNSFTVGAFLLVCITLAGIVKEPQKISHSALTKGTFVLGAHFPRSLLGLPLHAVPPPRTPVLPTPL